MLAGLRKTYVHFKRNSGLQQPAVKPSTISDSNYLSASSASTKDPVMRKQGGNDENVQLQQLSLPKAPAKTTKGGMHFLSIVTINQSIVTDDYSNINLKYRDR